MQRAAFLRVYFVTQDFEIFAARQEKDDERASSSFVMRRMRLRAAAALACSLRKFYREFKFLCFLYTLYVLFIALTMYPFEFNV